LRSCTPHHRYGTWMAHLLISSKELLHNLLIDTVRRPQRL
jgi:hypothetical protein